MHAFPFTRKILGCILQLVVLLGSREACGVSDGGASAPAPSAVASSQLFISDPLLPATSARRPPAASFLNQWKPEKQEFTLHPVDLFSGQTGETLLQRAQYREGSLSVGAEMGDLTINETPTTVSDLSRRGVRFSLAGTGTGTGVRMESFALSGARPGDDRSLSVGALGELSLFGNSAQLKTMYFGSKEMLDAGMRETDAARRGDVFGVMVGFQPYKERLCFDAELDYAYYDDNAADGVPAVGDKAYHAKVGGAASGYRYSALYERTGPRYQIIGGREPRRDWEGYSLGIGRDYKEHSLDVGLSRYNDNVERSGSLPTLFRYEGTLDYSLKKFKKVPMGVQYRKTVASTVAEGASRSGTDENTIAARISYLAGRWEWGMKGHYAQRTDLASDQRDLKTSSISLSPKYRAGRLTVAPDLCVTHSIYLLEKQRTKEYWAGVDVQGMALGGIVDYEVKGGFKKVLTAPATPRDEALGANVKVGLPIRKIFSGLPFSLVGVKGAYNGVTDPSHRISTYSFLVVVEGH